MSRGDNRLEPTMLGAAVQFQLLPEGSCLMALQKGLSGCISGDVAIIPARTERKQDRARSEDPLPRTSQAPRVKDWSAVALICIPSIGARL